ncbi:MAG: HU family DNA-binding protein [Prevotella sp.]|nr:HU family DNA-binding protein [Prevotella sp.]
MNNKEFITELAQRSGYSQDNVQHYVRSLVDAMADCFDRGENVLLPGFGTFEVRKRMERIVVNPTSGKRMMVPPKLVLSFRPVAAVKDQLKKGGSDE